MAAAPSKPSPSNRPVDGSASNTSNDAAGTSIATKDNALTPETAVDSPAPVDSPAAPTSSSSSTASSLPTYQSVEASDVYLLAKRHLSEGKFEEGMTVIEEGIRDTQEILKRMTSSPDGDFSVHESMAPFHYLYGTTLLYSIEEADQEVTTAGAAVSAAVVEGEQAEADDDAPADNELENNNDNPMVSSADVSEDMEIAWEHFEAARAIMEKMLESDCNKELSEKLELDLAQLHLREGDLQRMNGRNLNAIQDYRRCLDLRKKSKFLDANDRKIADVHYNLGLVYINVASKDEETPSDEDETANQASFTAKARSAEADERVKEAKRVEALQKSVHHFLQCSKCFCAQIASICKADPSSVTDVSNSDADNSTSKAQAVPNYKTTGEEDDELELPEIASSKLQTMRNRVKTLVSTSSLNADQLATVDELSELLGDIQETVDEAENATKGVKEVTNMKAEVAALAAADGEVGESKEGATTTIGFGSASLSTGVAVTAGASTSKADTAASPARPMMVVKKKKKRVAVQPVESPDAKKPKAEAE